MKADQFGHVNGVSIIYSANSRPRHAPDVITPNRQRFIDALKGTKDCKFDVNKMHKEGEKEKKQTPNVSISGKVENKDGTSSSFKIPFIGRT